jgi:hypothetical protein
MRLRIDLLTSSEYSLLKNKINEIRKMIDENIVIMNLQYYNHLNTINTELIVAERELLAIQSKLILELDSIDTTAMDHYVGNIDIDYLNHLT